MSSERYPLNPISSKPDSTEKATEGHHVFPRSQIKSDSWFVEILAEGEPEIVIPHVVGLSREEHDDIEQHRAWIKLEDGVFNWYERNCEEWVLLGPLNPQPGEVGTPKKKRRTFNGEAKRARVNWQVKVPKDAEDGAGILDDLLEQCEEKLVKLCATDGGRPTYYTLADVLIDWLTS